MSRTPCGWEEEISGGKLRKSYMSRGGGQKFKVGKAGTKNHVFWKRNL